MFFLRPNATWLLHGIKPFRGSAEQKGPLSQLFFTLSPRQKMQQFKANRRASDALGPQAQLTTRSPTRAVPFFVSVPEQPAQNGQLMLEYSASDWTSAEENRHLLELNDSADGMMNELSQTDRDLAALSAQAGTGMISADLSQTAQQTFARIDALMQRWSVRAEQIERAHSGTQWLAVGSAAGNRAYQATPTKRTPQHQQAQATPQNTAIPGRGRLPGNARYGDQRQARLDFTAQPLAPAAQIRQRRQRLADKYALRNTEKLAGLRQQMNQLAAVPEQMTARAGGLRRMALTRLSTLHGKIDHMAHELHEHRQNIEFSIQQRTDRRRAPRASFLPAPVLKPKVKDEATS